MRREQRLRRRADFSALYQQGRGWSNDLLALRARPTGHSPSRFGFSVGKRVGTAVVRNRVKRRLREAVRTLRPEDGWDIVIVARPPAATAGYWPLLAALRSLFGRARLPHTRPPAAAEGERPPQEQRGPAGDGHQ